MMIGRIPQPVIEKLTGVLGAGKSKGVKRYDLGGGIGLGIVAALEKSELTSHYHKPNKHVFITRNQARSIHVPVEMENSEEDYTFVTCHGPNKTKTSTRVYYDGDHHYGLNTRASNGLDKKSVKNHRCVKPVMFHISSDTCSRNVVDFPEPDFLSSCDLCHKKLHGKDIYMYRGEKAYCSTECRYVQIVKDERKEKQFTAELASSRSTISNADISTHSPYNTTTTGRFFQTGMLAT